VLCIYCRTDKFVYWPPAWRSPSADCPGCQWRIARPLVTLLAGRAGTRSQPGRHQPAWGVIVIVKNLGFWRD